MSRSFRLFGSEASSFMTISVRLTIGSFLFSPTICFRSRFPNLFLEGDPIIARVWTHSLFVVSQNLRISKRLRNTRCLRVRFI